MAFLSDTFGLSPARRPGLRSWWTALAIRMKRQAVARETYEQLSRLSDGELADIGISRIQIMDIAREVARSA